jgi:predicted metal-dependent phosphoesterase TrpH
VRGQDKDKVDLHVHTTASDGALTPSETVRVAKERGLKAIAITDHDTVDGVEEALLEGGRLSLEVIPGVEISAKRERGNLHLLGYFVEITSTQLTEGLERLKRARLERNPQIVQRLNDLDIPITYDEVVKASGGGQVGRPHFAQVLVKRGYAHSVNDAFERYLARGGAAFVEKYRLEVWEGVDMILEAGGVPVLAHPYTLESSPEYSLEDTMRELVQMSLKGIEAYYPHHTPQQTVCYERLAERFGLVKTGGSDFHGALIDSGQLGIIGEGMRLPYTTVEALAGARETIVSRL